MAVRVEGWLRVCSDDPETGRWQKRYCVLSPDERRLRFFADPEAVWLSPTLPVIKLDGSIGDSSDDDLAFDSGGCWQPGLRRGPSVFQRSSRSRLGVRVRASVKRSKSLTRKGEAAAAAVRSVRDSIATFPTSLKADRGSTRRNSVIGGSLRFGRSLDSIETYTSFGDPDTSIDLSIDPPPEISHLHYSIAPTDHCFQISLSTCVLYFAAPSRDAMRRWMERLLEPTQADRGACAITHDLVLRIIDGKNFKDIASKSKCTFYCEIEKDGAMKGRTASKPVPVSIRVGQEVIMWNEVFEFRNLMSLHKVVIKVFKDQGRRRTKGSQGQLVGNVELDLSDRNMGGEKESWHKLYDAHGRELACAIRVKCWFQTLTILPLPAYHDLVDYVLEQPMFAVAIDAGLDMRTREELYTSLLHVLRGNNQAVSWIADLVLKDLDDTASDSSTMIFRGNTIVTKCMECYMKQVSSEFLCTILRDTITLIYDSEVDCEVDPMKLQPSANLAANQSQLRLYVEKLWGSIYSSQVSFPGPLRKLFVVLRERVKKRETAVWHRLITGSFFLRYMNPAFLSPNTNGITRGYPEDKVARSLTLVAKVIQTLASETLFGRDSYMTFMNDFLEKERENMEHFLEAISSPSGDMVECRKTPPLCQNPASLGESTSATDVGVVRTKSADAKQYKDESQGVGSGFELVTVHACTAPSAMLGSPLSNGKDSTEAHTQGSEQRFVPQLPYASLNIGHELAMLHCILHATLPKVEKTIWKEVSPLPFIVSGLQQKIERPSTLLHPGMSRTGSLDRLSGMRIVDLNDISSSIVQVRQMDERSRHEGQTSLPSLAQQSSSSKQQAQQSFGRTNSETAVLSTTRHFDSVPSMCHAPLASPPPLDDVSHLSEVWDSVLSFTKRNNEPRPTVAEMTVDELAAEVTALRCEVATAGELFHKLGGCLASMCEALDAETKRAQWDRSSSHTSGYSRYSLPSQSSAETPTKPTLLQLSQEVRRSIDLPAPTLSSSVAQAIHDRHMSDPNAIQRRQLEALELANGRFSTAMEKHWKEFDGHQAGGDLLKINAALSSNKYHQLTGAKPC